MSVPLRLRLPLILALLPWAAFAADRWQPAGPEGGDVAAFAMEPADPRTLYAAAVYGGVFKSTDGAATWSPASDGLRGERALALAHDPKAAGTLYVGTDHGVFKTTNGGALWTAASAGNSLPATSAIGDLVVTPSAIYANVFASGPFGFETGLFKSTDRGASWSRLDLGRSRIVVTALAVDPTDPLVLYAGIEDLDSPSEIGVLRSSNGGAAWSPSGRGLPKGTIESLAIHPAAPRIVYAAIRGAGVYRSNDGGGLWRNVSRGVTNPALTALAFGPSRDTLYAAAQMGSPETGRLFRTTNGGGRWQRMDRGLSGDLQALAAEPRGSVLYAGSRTDGVFRSADSGASWTLADRGLRAVAAYAVVADPRRPGFLFAETPAFGLLKTVDGGVSWHVAGAGARALTPLAIDPQRPATVYALDLDGRVLRSRDGGRSWRLIESLPHGVAAFAIDPNQPSILYAAGPHRIDRSTDGGDTWTPDFTSSCLIPSFLAITPTSRVFAGALSFCGPNKDGSGIHERGADGGWPEANTGLLLFPAPSALAADPRQPSTLYTGISGHLFEPPGNISEVYKTTDGAIWSVVAGPGDDLHAATAFAFPPGRPGVVYAARWGLGVFVERK